MNILLIRSLFCPTKLYFDLCVKYIKIFLDHIKNINGVSVLMIGWVPHLKWQIEFINIVENYKKSVPGIKSINTQFWKLNYGKYALLNLFNNFAHNYSSKYIMYMDHDIQLGNDSNMLEIFYDIDNLFEDNVGIITFNQKEDIRHQKNIYKNVSYKRKMCISFPYSEDNICDGSIATGCFIISKKVIERLSAFENFPVYGPDDLMFCQKILDINYRCGVFLDCYVIHPFDIIDIEGKFKNWKKDMIIYTLNNGKDIDYSIMMENNINFWNSF